MFELEHVKLEHALREYAYNPEDPEKNLVLAHLYHAQNQSAGAISFYLRTAERTQDKRLSYYCLLKIAECFEYQGNGISIRFENFWNQNGGIMFELEHALCEYAYNPEDPEKNLVLAHLYHDQNQSAGAVSFYLRTAERTQDKHLSYYCLLKIAECFEYQGKRDNTVRCLYKHAISLLPERPEAYFLLSRHYERINEYTDSYMIAEIGLSYADEVHPELRGNVGYPGKYVLLFEKAVSSWWWGKSVECRKLLHHLADEYAHIMDETHYNAVQRNMTNLGAGPVSVAFKYNIEHHNKLRFKFPGSENIKRSYSQAFQDMFILSMLNGKRGGTYLEIGSAFPFLGNNTALLETEFDWKGLGIEYKQNLVEDYTKNRKNPVLLADGTKVNYERLLKTIAKDNVVDYLQLDCDPSKTTFEILLMIPFDKFKFSVITYEHDHYIDMTRSYRFKSRKYLEAMGYELVVSDVSPDGICAFEDWWVHPELVDRKIIELMKDTDGIKHIEKYFYAMSK
jgi:hypothetical protein